MVRPILFSGPMVRAILDGRKTQTRRAIRPQPMLAADIDERTVNPAWQAGFIDVRCPYGQPGDQLWVRETFFQAFRRPPATTGASAGCIYRADDDGIHLNPGWSPNGRGGGWQPSIFMPRWASRLTLRITGVRVERLQEIMVSPEDMLAEGVTAVPEAAEHLAYEYRGLWNSLNGADAWDLNPWVWVIEFARVQQQERPA